MLNSKNLSLALAFPLILVGCGTDSQAPTIVDEPDSTMDEATPMPGFEVNLSEDPVEQIDTINDSIELLEVEVSAAQTSVSGTYSYDVDYRTPKGVAPLDVTFTLEKNVITDVTLNGENSQQTSNQYQKLVQTELNELVVGKDYLEVSALPSKVAGSSLTPTAFNEALAQLQAEA